MTHGYVGIWEDPLYPCTRCGWPYNDRSPEDGRPSAPEQTTPEDCRPSALDRTRPAGGKPFAPDQTGQSLPQANRHPAVPAIQDEGDWWDE